METLVSAHLCQDLVPPLSIFQKFRGCEIVLFWFLIFLINSDIAVITGLVWFSLVFLPVQFFVCFPIG